MLVRLHHGLLVHIIITAQLADVLAQAGKRWQEIHAQRNRANDMETKLKRVSGIDLGASVR